MKPHALALAISALSAATAMAQASGDRYGYARSSYDAQQGQFAYGRTLTWANKTSYNPPANVYDNRYPQNGYQGQGYAPQGWGPGGQPYSQPQQAPNYAPQYGRPYSQLPAPNPAYGQPAYAQQQQAPYPPAYQQQPAPYPTYNQPVYAQPEQAPPAYANAYPQQQQYLAYNQGRYAQPQQAPAPYPPAYQQQQPYPASNPPNYAQPAPPPAYPQQPAPYPASAQPASSPPQHPYAQERAPYPQQQAQQGAIYRPPNVTNGYRQPQAYAPQQTPQPSYRPQPVTTYAPPAARPSEPQQLRPRVYAQGKGAPPQPTMRTYDTAPAQPRTYGQSNSNLTGRTLTPNAQTAQMEHAAKVYSAGSQIARVYGQDRAAAASALQPPYTMPSRTPSGQTGPQQPARSPSRSYEPAPVRSQVYGQTGGPDSPTPQTPYPVASSNGATYVPQASNAPAQVARSYEPTLVQARSYGQGSGDAQERPIEGRQPEAQTGPSQNSTTAAKPASARSAPKLASLIATMTRRNAPRTPTEDAEQYMDLSPASVQTTPIRPARTPVSDVARPSREQGAKPQTQLPARSKSAPSPVRVATAQPAERGQVHLYSLHREYGLKPDAIPTPDRDQGLVLIGPGDAPSGSNGSSNRDDDLAKEKAF